MKNYVFLKIILSLKIKLCNELVNNLGVIQNFLYVNKKVRFNSSIDRSFCNVSKCI